MGIKPLYNDNLRKLPNEYGDVSVMCIENVTADQIKPLYKIRFQYNKSKSGTVSQIYISLLPFNSRFSTFCVFNVA